MKKLMMLGLTGAAMALALIAEAGLGSDFPGLDFPGLDPLDPRLPPEESPEASSESPEVSPAVAEPEVLIRKAKDRIEDLYGHDIKQVPVREGFIVEGVLPSGDRLLFAVVVDAKAGAQYKIMGGSTQDSFPVEICRSPIVETSGELAFSGICNDSSLVFFDVLIVEDSDVEVDPVKSLDPTCDGGTIEKGDGGWVVTPTNGAAKVVITGLPEGETVAGGRLGNFVVPSGAFVGFAEGKTEGEFSLALDPAGEVTIGTETIRVQPTIGEGVEEPFVVGEEDGEVVVAVKVKSIPGLTYGLWRAGTLEAPAGESAGGTVLGGGTEWGPVVSVVAEATTVTLKDAEPPEGAAFYRVVVSAW